MNLHIVILSVSCINSTAVSILEKWKASCPPEDSRCQEVIDAGYEAEIGDCG